MQSPTSAPIVHTVKVVTPPKTYNCDGVGGSPDPSWSVKHRRWCCYKYNTVRLGKKACSFVPFVSYESEGS